MLFMSGQGIYENFQNGVGPTGLTNAAAVVNELAGEYEQEADSIKQLMAQMESVWQGDAAGGATRGAGPLAVEHLAAAPDISKAQELINGQASAYDEAKRTVQPVPPAPEEPGMWDNVFSLGGAQDTYESKLAATNAASQVNVDAMTRYEGVSGDNTTGLPTTYGSIIDDQAGIVVGPSQPAQLPPGPGQGQAPPPVPGNSGTQAAGFQSSVPVGSPGGGFTGPSGFTPPGAAPTPGPGGGPGGPGLIPNGPGGPGFGPGGPGFGPGRPGGPQGPGGRPFGPGGPGNPGGRPGGPGSGPGNGFGPRGGGAGGFGPSGRGFGPTGGGFGPTGEPGPAGSRAGAGPMGGAGAGGMGPGGGAGAGGRGAGGTGAGGGMGGAGGRGQGGEDGEHSRPSYLIEPDAEDVFGTDQKTAPPVIE